MKACSNTSMTRSGTAPAGFPTSCSLTHWLNRRAPPLSLPAEAGLQLGVLRGGRLPLGEHPPEKVRQLVRVRHVSLVEREVVLEKRLAETVHPDQLSEILRNVWHHLTPFAISSRQIIIQRNRDTNRG